MTALEYLVKFSGETLNKAQLSTWSTLENIRNRIGVGLAGGMKDEVQLDAVDDDYVENDEENYDDYQDDFNEEDNLQMDNLDDENEIAENYEDDCHDNND